MKTSTVVSQKSERVKHLASRSNGNEGHKNDLEDNFNKGIDYFDYDDEADLNPIETILTVTKKGNELVSGKKADNNVTKKSSLKNQQLSQPSFEKWSSGLNNNNNNNNKNSTSISRKPNAQFVSSINGTSLASSNDLASIFPKIGKNSNSNNVNEVATNKQQQFDNKVQLLPLSEQSIKRIRALLKLDQHEYTAPTGPPQSRQGASPPRRRVPKRGGALIQPQTPSSSTMISSSELMVLKASSMNTGATNKSTTPSLSSSSSSSSSNATRRQPIAATIPPPISSYQYPVYVNNTNSRRRDDEYLVMAAPPSTPLLHSLEDSVIIEECYICQQEQHHHQQHHNNFKKYHATNKNNRVLVPKVSSSLLSLNPKQFI